MSEYEQVVTGLREALVGKRIKSVGYMHREDVKAMGWLYGPIVIELEDGTSFFPMADDEGNDGGALATSIEGLETIGVRR